LRQKGQVQEALIAWCNLLNYYINQLQPQGLSFTANEVRIVDRLADLALLTGQQAAASHLLAALTSMARKVHNVPLRIHAATKWLLVQLGNGNGAAVAGGIHELADITGDVSAMEISPEGLADWENNLRLGPGINQQDRADCMVCLYDLLGAFLLSWGRFGDSVILFERALQHTELFTSKIIGSRQLPVKLLQVRALFQQGEVVKAKAILLQLEPEVNTAELTSGIQFQWWDLQSRIALAQGELGVAHASILNIIYACQEHGLVQAEVQASINLAITKIILNHSKEAIDILSECLQRSEQVKNERLTAKIGRLMVVAKSRMQVTMPALNYRREAKINPPASTAGTMSADIERNEDYLSFFEEKALLFQSYLAEHREENAATVLYELRPYIDNCDSALIKARYELLQYRFLYFTNATIPNEFPVQRILDYLKKENLLPELWQFRQFVGHTDFVKAKEQAAWKQENQRLLNVITDSLPPIMRALYLLNKWSPNEEYLAGIADQLLQIKMQVLATRFSLTRWWRNLGFMKQVLAYRQQVNRYKDHLARSVIQGSSSPFTFTSLSGTIQSLWRQPKDILAISYLVLPDRVVIISRSFLRVRFYTTFISRVQLRRIVFLVRDWLYPKGAFRGLATSKSSPEAIEDPKELIAQLGDVLQLQTILEENRKGIKHISFDADDVLYGFPFSLLKLNGKEIFEQVGISVVVENGNTTRKAPALHTQKVLLTGVSGAVHGLQSLPGVVAEIEQIKGLLTTAGATVNTLMNSDATIEALQQQLPKVDLAHFACHGLFDHEQPDKSGLLLSNGDVFTLRQILLFNELNNLQLLVLSSCRGAEHFVLPGRWLIGLPETFCRAGVGAVLAFLWPVDDSFAAAFTVRFYELLKAKPAVEAYRLALSDAKNNRLHLSFDHSHPKYWAGAVLYER
jgi:hypothetical protein